MKTNLNIPLFIFKWKSVQWIRSIKHVHTSSRNCNLKWSYTMQEKSRPLVGWTVGQVIENSVDKFGDNELLLSCHQGISKTFTQLNKETSDFAAGLLSVGFKPGDRIGIWGPNSYEWCITKFAAAKAGLILVNINPAYRSTELKYCLNKVEVKGLVCANQFKSANYYNMVTEIAPEIQSAKPSTEVTIREIPNLKYIISMEDAQLNGAFNFKQIPEAAGSKDKHFLEELKTKIQFDDPFNIQFTSGTTGSPKAAVLSHFNIVNNSYFMGIRTNFHIKKERVALCVPLFHCFGSITGLLTNVIFGNTTILPSETFDPIAILKSIRDDRISSCYGTPTMFFDIVKEFKKNPFDIKYLHTGIMGGSPCPEDLVSTVMEDLKMKDFKIAFGMTETSPATFISYPDDSPELRTTTVGYVLDQTEAKVVDEYGRIVPTGVPGELLIRGYCVFLGYWADELKTNESLQKDRWFKTGDLVMMDENGNLRISGRIKDIIIRGGENIYPAEVESFFLSHESIMETQVFGVPDKRMGEEIAMWFKSPDKCLTEDDIKKWAKGKIAHYKIPKYIIMKDAFPTTISGKNQKFVMKRETIKELGLNNLQ